MIGPFTALLEEPQAGIRPAFTPGKRGCTLVLALWKSPSARFTGLLPVLQSTVVIIRFRFGFY